MAKRAPKATRPPVFLVGLAGDSGVGKETFAHGLVQIFGKENVTWISLNDYHSMDRLERRRRGITPLDPRANQLQQMAEHALLLKEGKAIEKPIYDHNSGKINGSETVEPRPIVVMTGLLTYWEEPMRQLFDYKIFVDAEEELKWKWKEERDTTSRGYTLTQVRAERQARKRDYERFIKPQKAYADMVIRRYPATTVDFPNQMHVNTLLVMKSTGRKSSGQNLIWFCNECDGIDSHHDTYPLVIEIAEQVRGQGIIMLQQQILNGTALLAKRQQANFWTLGDEKSGLQMSILILSWYILAHFQRFDEVALDPPPSNESSVQIEQFEA